MKSQLQQCAFSSCARALAALLAGVILIPGLRAQPTEQTVQSRFLFVFDTSRVMKSRLEATKKVLNTLLATSLGGQLHAGEDVGVWTFSQDLRPGDYQLQVWNPDQAVMIASNLTKFISKQTYAKRTRFEALQPTLNLVMQDSERLTVLIFCDGDSKFSGTPFDDGINQVFAQKLAEQKKTGQPFVIILRSQLGQYVGCSVGLPPQPLTYPQFPPLPAPPPPVVKETNAPPPPKPVVKGSPLIIIGTSVLDHLPPPGPEPTGSTNPPTVSIPTNAAATSAAAARQETNLSKSMAVGESAQGYRFNHRQLILAAAGLLGAALLLGILLKLRSRRKDPSIITRSMKDP